jgi:hypothetical protein
MVYTINCTRTVVSESSLKVEATTRQEALDSAEREDDPLQPREWKPVKVLVVNKITDVQRGSLKPSPEIPQ